MRAYPKGLRISSSNLDPVSFWRQGVQIVALNWQKCDAGTMLNDAMFAGSGGWILKPAEYRSGSKPVQRRDVSEQGTLNLEIEFYAGQDIPPPPEEKPGKTLKPYVKCELHLEKRVERAGETVPGGGKIRNDELKRHTKTSKTFDPDFGREKVAFSGVRDVIPELTFVR